MWLESLEYNSMYRTRLAETLPRILEAIQKAAGRVGRNASEVTLVAVTKAHPPAALEAAIEAGLRDLGENRVEELEGKVRLLGRDACTWHMVGHVQSRKAKQVAEVADILHSLDRMKLARRISESAVESGRRIPGLIQVNFLGEETKSGFRRDEALEVIHQILELPGVEVRGLMTMAPFVEDENTLREAFRGLRRIHEEAGKLQGYTGTELSMGMTNDFELAVEEGSTMVRIGTALFGERPR